MPKRRKLTLTPQYRRDKADPTRAVAVWKDLAGKKHRKVLPGDFDSPESRAAVEELRADIRHSRTGAPPRRGVLTVAALLDTHMRHAERYYRTADGRQTSAVWHFRGAGRALCALSAHTPVTKFGPRSLQAALHRWACEGHTRSQCNRRLACIKQVFKWGAAQELVPSEVYWALMAVPGLQRGRTPARETEPVRPVADATVDATLPFLGRPVRGLVEFQRLTGCRPGEACAVRRCDIDTRGPVWLFTPPHHKTAHLGMERVIPIGPRAQAVLAEFFTADPTDYLFSPRRAVAAVLAGRSAGRTTPRWPSHMARNRRKRKRARDRRRPPGPTYTNSSYSLAVRRACDQAFPLPDALRQREGETRGQWRARLTEGDRAQVREWRVAHRWHPNQLRHRFATRVRQQHGLEAAQVLLGHAEADVTQIYAERNLGLAAQVAAEIG